MRIRPVVIAALAVPLVASNASAQSATVIGNAGTTLSVAPVTDFNEPWAMTFLPDGNLLVTEKSGNLLLVSQDGEKTKISGVPNVAYGGQGGLGDIVLHPQFSENDRVYISFAEPGDGNTRGAAVASAVVSAVVSATAAAPLARIVRNMIEKPLPQ